MGGARGEGGRAVAAGLTGGAWVPARVVDPSADMAMEVRARMAEHLSAEQSRILAAVLEDVVLGGPEAAGADYVERFLAAKAVEGCTPRTLKFYRQQLADAVGRFGKPVRAVGPADIRGLLAAMRARGCSDVTMNNTRRALSSFFNWLEDEDVIRKSPARKVKPVREEKVEKLPFSDDEQARLRQEARNGPGGIGPARSAAMVELLLSSGMRVGELVGLERSRIDLDARECTVYGKGRKERTCYFSAEAALALREYFGMRGDGEPWAFVSLTRRDGRFRQVSTSQVENVIRGIGARAGVEKCHPHRFRRTMATTALRRGMPLEDIQQLLGHEKVETTLIYAKTTKENVRNTAMRLI